MWWLLLIPVGVVLFVTGFALYAWRTAFYMPRKERGAIFHMPNNEQYRACKPITDALRAEMEALPFEVVSITSHDGLVLTGKYYHLRDGAPLQIQFHGYRGTALRDFCGGHKLAVEQGYNTLVIDQRAHGDSGGCNITFGLLERYDCLCWARYAAARFPDTPIVLAGVSMGAATVLMAADLPLPETVRAIMADSPYTTPCDIIRKVCADRGLPPSLAFPFVKLGARLYGGFRLTEEGAVHAVARTSVPLLIIHGEDDLFVPVEMSRALDAACVGEHRLVTFPGAGHGLSYIVDPERYAAETAAFLDQYINR